jgi:hypothetical protein
MKSFQVKIPAKKKVKTINKFYKSVNEPPIKSSLLGIVFRVK